MSTPHKLWALFNPKQRRGTLVLLVLMVIGVMLEMLGIGLVIPALGLITQSNLVDRYPNLAPWLLALGNPSHTTLVIIGMTALVGVYAIKALFLAFLAWWQTRFVYGVQADLSQRLYSGYLRQPYTFHLQHNSAQLIRNVINETNFFTYTALISGLTFLTEGFVFIGVVGLLFAIEPLGMLILSTVLGGLGFVYQRLSRSRIARWAEARQFHEGMRIQHVQQGLGAIKDVKLLGREGEFLAQYWLHNSSSAQADQRKQTLEQLPRLGLEFLAVAALATIVIVMTVQGRAIETMLPMLGVFAVTAFRLLPSVNRMVSSFQSVRYARPIVNTLHAELDGMHTDPVPVNNVPLSFNGALTLDELCFRYPTAEREALRGVTLAIHFGSSVGFIGKSGSGKSTLVDIILGLLTPDSGMVKVDGIDIQSNLQGWQSKVGYVPQSIYLTDDTLRRNIALGLPESQIDDLAVWRALRAAQLEQFVNDLPQGVNTPVGERGILLSGGQRQRIGIARALYHDPSVLILDEATSSLDTATEQAVMEAVRAISGNKTVLIVAHRLSTVAHCDHLFRVEDGRVMQDVVTSQAI